MTTSIRHSRPVSRRDPYSVVVWERHGHWADRLKRWLRVGVEWREVRGWAQCQETVVATGAGAVLIVPGGATKLGGLIERIQWLRRTAPMLPVIVIHESGRPADEWLLREAGAADVVRDAIAARRVVRLIERDFRRQPPSVRPLTELIAEQLPWRPLAGSR